MKSICLLSFLTIAAGSLSLNKALAAHHSNKPLNVIFIYADDMGKGMLSAYGQKQFTTPNIDKIINRGTSFANAYGCMLSAPARASLLTGYHDCHVDKWSISPGGKFVLDVADTAQIKNIEKEIDSSDVSLMDGDDYLAQVFKKAGYVTAQIGKLEWGFTATRKQMKNHGWDYYYGYLDHVRCHGFYPPFLFDNDSVVAINGNTHRNCGKSIEQETVETLKERWNREGKEVYSQDLFFDKMISFLHENKDKPFFLFHPTQLPHGPVSVPAIHPEIASNSNLTTIEKEYASMLKLLDSQVGMLINELDNLGISDRTLIVFSADNGHEIYYSQKGRCEKPYRNLQDGNLFDNDSDKYYSETAGDIFNGNAGMAGLKRSNLEGGIHVPLAFYCKDVIAAGVVINRNVSNYDFLSTMADLLNVKVSSSKDGESYLSALMKSQDEPRKSDIILGSNEGPALIQPDGWKLRYYLSGKKWELYYLPTDPKETTDLSSENKELLSGMKRRLLKACNGNIENGVNKAG